MILTGRLAEAVDILIQRFKSVEAATDHFRYRCARYMGDGTADGVSATSSDLVKYFEGEGASTAGGAESKKAGKECQRRRSWKGDREISDQACRNEGKEQIGVRPGRSSG
eukprot:3495264-Amphidinium_carterae.1